jgi:hypothetical protein
MLGNTLKEGEVRREDVAEHLIVFGGNPVEEDRTAEARANGKAGSSKQCR